VFIIKIKKKKKKKKVLLKTGLKCLIDIIIYIYISKSLEYDYCIYSQRILI